LRLDASPAYGGDLTADPPRPDDIDVASGIHPTNLQAERVAVMLLSPLHVLDRRASGVGRASVVRNGCDP